MLKNIVIFILLGIIAFLFVLNQNKTTNTSKTELDSKTESMTEIKTEVQTEKEEEQPTPKISNSLDLSEQNLDKLPESVLSNTSLEELNISNNNLMGALPAEIRRLQNLKVLNASNNKMTGVPAEIGQLENLEILDLSNNKLTGLPNELGNLKNLKVLNLSGNDYSKQDLELIKQNLPEDVEIL